MTDAKQLVTSYIHEVWTNRNIAALDNYISSDRFIQHNPHLEDGLNALRTFLPHLFNSIMPEGSWELKRVIAENDMVVTHSLAKPTPSSLGMAVVDIFRVENGKIVEHWDVTSDIPEETASGNSVV